MLTIDSNTLFGFWPRRNIDSSPKSLISRMDKADVDKALTCSIRGMLYDFVEGNDETWRICSLSDSRLLPVATINPQMHFGVLDEVDRIIGMGFRAVRFFPTEQEWSIRERHVTKLLDRLAQTDLVLMVPSTEGLTSISSATQGMRNAVIIETIRAYIHVAEMIAVVQDTPNLYIETHLIGGMDFVEVLSREIGDNRLVFGSGHPLHCFSSSTLPILNAAIPDDSKSRILSGNIRELLGVAK